MSHPSMLVLDSLALGILDGDERARTEAHLAGCARCRVLLDEAISDERRFRREVLPRALARMAPRRRPRRLRVVAFLAPVLAAAAMLLVLFRPSLEPTLGVKGGSELTVIARRHDQQLTVREGTRLVAGDALRFVVSNVREPFVMLVSVDGAGRPSIYHPFDGEKSVPIAERARVELPGAVALDETTGPERLFLLLSAQPLSAEPVRRALSALGARGAAAIREARLLSVEGVSEQRTVLIEKGP